MSRPSLSMPWASGCQAYSLPGSLVLKMALGEAPAAVPVSADVRGGRLAPATTIDGGPVDRIIKHFAGDLRATRVHAAAATLTHPGARHLRFNDREQILGLARTFRVDVPVGTPIAPLVDSLNQLAAVDNATVNYLSTTPFETPAPAAMQEREYSPWEAIHAAEALAYEPGDSAVIVAIVDTGIARQHPDLPPVRAGFDTVQLGRGDLAAGLRLLGDEKDVDTNPEDRYVGHGTACAGIIGAIGVGMPPGTGGAAQLLPMRGLGAARFPGKTQPVGIGATTDLDMAVKMAVDLGAKVINMSFGTDDAALDAASPKPHAEVVAYALERGCVLVAASGNSYGEATYWPAAYPGVIAVGAVDSRNAVSAFSTRGAHVAVCAPGERVRSLGLAGYQDVTGTSFAAPFVAGVSALLVARAARRSTALESQTVRNLLRRAASPFTGGAAGCGAGVLDALATLRALDDWLNETLPGPTEDVEDG